MGGCAAVKGAMETQLATSLPPYSKVCLINGAVFVAATSLQVVSPATLPIGVTVLAEASNGADAVALARTEDVDLVIQDVAMPGMTGLHAAREIARRTPHPPILMLSMYNEQYFSEGLKAGASEYLLISVADQDLVQACH
jgi:DNA-binding NarL/FixJ family response regulator